MGGLEVLPELDLYPEPIREGKVVLVCTPTHPVLCPRMEIAVVLSQVIFSPAGQGVLLCW